MRRKMLMAGVLLACVILQGCALDLPGREETKQTGSRMVTRISVASVPENASEARVYTDSEKIQAVLDYLESLKLLERHSNGSDPYGGATRTITVQYSGGSSKVYYLVQEKFLREGDAEWMYVEEEPEISLEEILRTNVSDMEPTAE